MAVFFLLVGLEIKRGAISYADVVELVGSASASVGSCGGQPRKADACSRTNSATVRGGRPVRSAMVLVIVTVLPPIR